MSRHERENAGIFDLFRFCSLPTGTEEARCRYQTQLMSLPDGNNSSSVIPDESITLLFLFFFRNFARLSSVFGVGVSECVEDRVIYLLVVALALLFGVEAVGVVELVVAVGTLGIALGGQSLQLVICDYRAD